MDTAAHPSSSRAESHLSPSEANPTELKREAPVIHNINPTVIPGKCLAGKQRHDLEVMDVAATARG